MRSADDGDKAHCRHRGLVLSLGKPPGVLLIQSFFVHCKSLTGSVAKSLERVFKQCIVVTCVYFMMFQFLSFVLYLSFVPFALCLADLVVDHDKKHWMFSLDSFFVAKPLQVRFCMVACVGVFFCVLIPVYSVSLHGRIWVFAFMSLCLYACVFSCAHVLVPVCLWLYLCALVLVPACSYACDIEKREGWRPQHRSSAHHTCICASHMLACTLGVMCTRRIMCTWRTMCTMCTLWFHMISCTLCVIIDDSSSEARKFLLIHRFHASPVRDRKRPLLEEIRGALAHTSYL